jgi:hypothetical protein
MTDIGTKAGDFVQDLGATARQNPLPAALIGMGVLWMFAGGARRAGLDPVRAANDAAAAGRSAMRNGWQAASSGASDLADNVRQSAQEAGGHAREAAASIAGGLRESRAAVFERTSRFGSQAADSATEFARSVPLSASEILSDARSNLAVMFRQQPLLLGAVGLAIGAGVAASFPATELESEYLGETSDQVKEQAEEFAAAQAERAKQAAERALQAANEEARRQGLHPDALQSSANDVGEKIKTLAGAAAESVKDRVSQS